MPIPVLLHAVSYRHKTKQNEAFVRALCVTMHRIAYTHKKWTISMSGNNMTDSKVTIIRENIMTTAFAVVVVAVVRFQPVIFHGYNGKCSLPCKSYYLILLKCIVNFSETVAHIHTHIFARRLNPTSMQSLWTSWKMTWRSSLQKVSN